MAKGDVSGAIENGQVIKFNGGGHLNHSIFWTNLAPKSQGGGDPPTGMFKQCVIAKRYVVAFQCRGPSNRVLPVLTGVQVNSLT